MEEENKKELKEEVYEEVKDIKIEKVVEEPNVKDKKGLGIASMVLGICSLALFAETIIATACAILAVIFGVKAKDSSAPKMAKSGFIMGIVSLGIRTLFLLLGLVLGFVAVGSLMTALISL